MASYAAMSVREPYLVSGLEPILDYLMEG